MNGTQKNCILISKFSINSIIFMLKMQFIFIIWLADGHDSVYNLMLLNSKYLNGEN